MTRITRNQVKLSTEPSPSSSLESNSSAFLAPSASLETTIAAPHSTSSPFVDVLRPVEDSASMVLEGNRTTSEPHSKTSIDRPKRKPKPVTHYRDSTRDSLRPKSPTTKKRTKPDGGDCTSGNAKRPRQSSAEVKIKTPRSPRRSAIDSPNPSPSPTSPSSSGLETLVAATQPFTSPAPTIPTFVATPKPGDWAIYDSIWNPVQFGDLKTNAVVPRARENGVATTGSPTPRKRVKRVREQETYPEIASQAFLKDDRVRMSSGQSTPRSQQGTYSSLLLPAAGPTTGSSFIVTSWSTYSQTCSSSSSTLSSPSPSIFDLDLHATTSSSTTSSPVSCYLGSPPPKSRYNPSAFDYAPPTERSLFRAVSLPNGGRGGVVLEERRVAFGHPISCERGTC